MSSQPPFFATWLLGHSPVDEAVAGDLLEEFRQRRSAAWYWRQVLIAIAVSFGKEFRTHWPLDLRASVIGLAASTVATIVGHFVIVKLFQTRIVDVNTFPRFVPWFVTSFLSGVVSGWLVAALHPGNRAGALFTFAATLFLWTLWGRGVMQIGNPSHSLQLVPAAQSPGKFLTDYAFVLSGVILGSLMRRPSTGTAVLR